MTRDQRLVRGWKTDHHPNYIGVTFQSMLITYFIIIHARLQLHWTKSLEDYFHTRILPYRETWNGTEVVRVEGLRLQLLANRWGDLMMSQDTTKRAPVGTVGKKKKQRSDARIKWKRWTNFLLISRADDELFKEFPVLLTSWCTQSRWIGACHSRICPKLRKNCTESRVPD